jgi:hypothetical protein
MDERFWQLKESAKWSLDLNDRREAVQELARNYGRDAIQALTEIKDVTAYADIKKACIEAIKANRISSDPLTGKSKKRSKVSRKRGKGAKKSHGRR